MVFSSKVCNIIFLTKFKGETYEEYTFDHTCTVRVNGLR